MRRVALSILLLVLFTIALITLGAETKQVAVTIDDLPASNIATFKEQLRINQKILKILNQYQAKATGFVISSRMFKKTDILNLWLKEGHVRSGHRLQIRPGT